MEHVIHIGQSRKYHIDAFEKVYQNFKSNLPLSIFEELLCEANNTLACKWHEPRLVQLHTISRTFIAAATSIYSTAIGSTVPTRSSFWSSTTGTAVIGQAAAVATWDMAGTTFSSSETEQTQGTVIPPIEIEQFCTENALDDTLHKYIDLAHQIFDNAELSLTLSEDPEIENYKKIALNIKLKEDVEVLLKKDREFFDAADKTLPDDKKEYFVKTYEIIE